MTAYSGSIRLRRAIGKPAACIGLVLALLSGCGGGAAEPALDTGRLGRIDLRPATGPSRGLVFLFSGAQGWGAREVAAATVLSSRGAIVIGVDLPQYRAALDKHDGECLYLLSEIEALSQQVQRQLGVERYFSPIMAGLGEGGTLVTAALAQTPDATVAGSVAVDPTETLRTRLPLCEGATFSKGPSGFRYAAAESLPGFLSIGFSPAADAAGRSHILAIQKDGPGIQVDRDEAGATKPLAAAEDATSLLIELVTAHLAEPQPAHAAAAYVVEMRSKIQAAPLVIILSGDGGWRDLDKTIAGSLHDRGLNVIGWDSLRYFWNEKSPDDLAKDLADVVTSYSRDWQAPAVALVGYSFGADVIPFAYNRFDQPTRDHIKMLSLLGLSDAADFEIRVTGWLGGKSSDKALPLRNEMAKIPPALIQCFYGEEEDDSGCPALDPTKIEVIKTQGEHHFDGNYEALAGRILAGLARRGVGLALTPPPFPGSPAPAAPSPESVVASPPESAVAPQPGAAVAPPPGSPAPPKP
ncbi:MAG TPA: AcvB/VirJ family lysyl-phosphatidylglycerol hydrolase [Candidatus Binatia bacterium]|jgi:type IV secretory pathway VirJ component